MSENMQSCPSCGELVPIEYVVCVWCGFDLTAEHIRRAGIVIGRKEAFQRMIKMIRDPFRTAKEIALIPDLTGGKLIFYLLGIAMTLNMIVVFGKLDGTDFNASDAGIQIALSKRISFLISFKFIVGVTFLLVQPIVLYLIFRFVWKYSTRIMKVLIKSVGGHADDEKIKCAIGYSMFPVLLGWTLSLLFTLMSSKVNITGGVTYNSINDAVVQITRHGVGIVGYIFIIIGWIAAIVLMVINMRQVAKMSIAESVVAAGLPSTFMMIIVVFGTQFLA